jgi:hypothetical protein
MLKQKYQFAAMALTQVERKRRIKPLGSKTYIPVLGEPAAHTASPAASVAH